MRDIGATLTAAQKTLTGDPVCTLVLTFSTTTKTYGVATNNRIMNLSHVEQEWSQTAEITVDNADKTLTALTLEGYKGVISYGWGANSSDAAPLTVIGQKADSMRGILATTFSLAGLFNLWGEQEATEAYTPDEINTDTIKTILDAIASHSMTCYGSYPVHTIVYETIAGGYAADYDDGIINAFTPNDHFSVAKGESRLSAFKKALAYTKCKAIVKNDSGTATIHVFQHETSSYDYEYNDAIDPDNHNFFDKSVRTRLVLPNKVWAGNHPDHTDSYSGTATDSASYIALNNQYYTKTVYCRPVDNTQAALIAAAVLLKYQLAAEKGHGFTYMNCGQEVLDYVKITDSRAGDDRSGNIGYIKRTYNPDAEDPFAMEFRFGTLEIIGLAGTVPPRQTRITVPTGDTGTYASLVETVASLIESHNSLVDSFNTLEGDMAFALAKILALTNYVIDLQWEDRVAKLDVYLRMQIPEGSDMYT